MPRLAVEEWWEFWPDAEPLFAAHAEELGAERFWPHDPDVEKLAELSAAGATLLFVARADESNEMLGYCTFYISPNLESKGQLIASQGPWYVVPQQRASGLGLTLIRRALPILQRRGIGVALLHHWGNEVVGKFLAHLGAEPIEYVYALPLNALKEG